MLTSQLWVIYVPRRINNRRRASELGVDKNMISVCRQQKSYCLYSQHHCAPMCGDAVSLWQNFKIIEHALWNINSLRSSYAYMRQQIKPLLVQIMACRLFGAKSFSEPMLEYCRLDPLEQISVKYLLKYIHFHSNKYIWKCRLQNGGHFVPIWRIVNWAPVTLKWNFLSTKFTHENVWM